MTFGAAPEPVAARARIQLLRSVGRAAAEVAADTTSALPPAVQAWDLGAEEVEARDSIVRAVAVVAAAWAAEADSIDPAAGLPPSQPGLVDGLNVAFVEVLDVGGSDLPDGFSLRARNRSGVRCCRFVLIVPGCRLRRA